MINWTDVRLINNVENDPELKKLTEDFGMSVVLSYTDPIGVRQYLLMAEIEDSGEAGSVASYDRNELIDLVEYLT